MKIKNKLLIMFVFLLVFSIQNNVSALDPCGCYWDGTTCQVEQRLNRCGTDLGPATCYFTGIPYDPCGCWCEDESRSCGGTPHRECVLNSPPQHCFNGQLIDRCSVCGCDANEGCLLSGSCETCPEPNSIASCDNSCPYEGDWQGNYKCLTSDFDCSCASGNNCCGIGCSSEESSPNFDSDCREISGCQSYSGRQQSCINAGCYWCGDSNQCANNILGCACTDDCTNAGERQCAGNSVTECGNFDFDSCMDERTIDCGDAACTDGFCISGEQKLKYYYDNEEGCLDDSNSVGRVCKIEDESGSTLFKYDVKGRVIEEIKKIGNRAYRIFYEYDSANNLVSITNPEDLITEYVYDDVGRLSEVKFNDESLITYEYNERGMIESSVMNNVYTKYTYGDLDYLTSMYSSIGEYYSDERVFERTYALSSIGDVEGVYYTVDRSNPGAHNNLQRTEDYRYDILNRLISSQYPGNEIIEYSYDQVGNRIEMTKENNVYTYYYTNDNNQLTRISSTNENIILDYDAVGNLIEFRGAVYSYDENNRLTTIILPDGNVIKYVYDYTGKAVKKIDKEKTTYYVYNGNNVIYEEEIFIKKAIPKEEAYVVLNQEEAVD